MEEPVKRASLSRNPISAVGALIAFVALTNTIFLIYINSRQAHGSPYLGILAWIVAPAILSFGLIVYIAGLLIERRRRHKRAPGDLPKYPAIDLNVRRTRKIVAATFAGVVLFVTASVIGSFQAFHYTESDQFCGTTCHQPMHPENIAHQISPHARVACVACHVGGGPEYYVRSKINGTHQLIGVITGNYERPIATPINNLRPARDTCEQCHWSEKNFGSQLRVFSHYQYDEQNTPTEVRLLIHVGGGNPATGVASGIHWHMNLANKVDYVAVDPQRQDIPWVRMTDRNGKVTDYVRADSKVTPAQIANARHMDCVDCHSRPAHNYLSPDRAVDRALLTGSIDRSLPYAKQQAVNILSKNYGSTAQAVQTIGRDFPAYYSKTYPDVYAARRASVDNSAKSLQRIFQLTRFPEMRVDWRTHRDNLGHMYSLGCFRCHDDQHVSKDGRKISKECSICHDVLGGTEGKTAQFEHPVEVGDLRDLVCTDCHTGGDMTQ